MLNEINKLATPPEKGDSPIQSFRTSVTHAAIGIGLGIVLILVVKHLLPV